MLKLIRKHIANWRMRRRFPAARLYAGASIDRESHLARHAVLFSGVSLYRSQIGAYSYVQQHSAINNADMGAFCSIAGQVVIGLAIHPTHLVSTCPVFYDPQQPLPFFFAQQPLQHEVLPRTIVGADVWIGHGALIKAGVSIGVGAVVGAGSIVTRDVAPYTIVAGNPARPIRRRFDDATCEALLATRWWELDDVRLLELAPLFADPAAFLKALSESS